MSTPLHVCSTITPRVLDAMQLNSWAFVSSGRLGSPPCFRYRKQLFEQVPFGVAFAFEWEVFLYIRPSLPHCSFPSLTCTRCIFVLYPVRDSQAPGTLENVARVLHAASSSRSVRGARLGDGPISSYRTACCQKRTSSSVW